MKIIDPETNDYWVCIIGPIKRKELPDDADFIPRRYAIVGVESILKHGEVGNCWSGWGCNEETKNKIMEVWNNDSNN